MSKPGGGGAFLEQIEGSISRLSSCGDVFLFDLGFCAGADVYPNAHGVHWC
jgi:hypothetical protein